MVVGGSSKTLRLDLASVEKVVALSSVGKYQERVGTGGKEKGMLSFGVG